MSFISESAILWAIQQLKATTHPFLGITFLACKKHVLPVGETKRVRLDTLTKGHLHAYHRLDQDSKYFFQPFKSTRNWVAGNYASTGLQAVNTQTFRKVFLHERGSPEWGFAPDYLYQLRSRLRTLGYRRSPLAALAIWTAKNLKYQHAQSVDVLIESFLASYRITELERKALFSSKVPPSDAPPPLFQIGAADLRAVALRVAPPPDAEAPEGTLTAIEVSEVGPADSLRLDLGERLTVVAGDNGLGKSFLLDVIWWAATGRWARRPAIPIGKWRSHTAHIAYDIRTGTDVHTCFSRFDLHEQEWIHQSEYPQVPALYVYACADGTFAVEDDFRARNSDKPLVLTPEEIWHGKPGVMEGLVRDWVGWQVSKSRQFSLFNRVLAHLSPDDLGPLQPVRPTRLPGEPRRIPVVRHPYGDVPILHASAGVRRILAFTYMIVWAWQEHLLQAELLERQPTRRLVLLIDEIDAHLHPRWQRAILPAILEVARLIEQRLRIQVIGSTHSPLVLASLETNTDPSTDVLYHLRIDSGEVVVERLDFQKRGDVSSWLTAPEFGLRYARSKEAERVLEEATALQLDQATDAGEIERVSQQLLKVLAPDDPFWRRWTFFAEQAGVDL